MFRQGVEESFGETWERFMMMLRRCPNHGFEDIAQLSIFINGLRFDTKVLLDAATGGTMMVVDVEQATRIIEALATTEYQAQHGRQSHQKRGLLELNTADALLAQNKILTQQIKQLTAQMDKLPQKLHVVNSYPKVRIYISGVIFGKVIILMVTVLISPTHLKLR